MKRFVAAFLSIILLISASGSIIYAENSTEQKSRGLLEGITYDSDGIYEVVDIKASGYTGYITEILSNPDRIVIDLTNVQVPEGQGRIKTSGEFVNSVRYSQYTSTAARVVVDVNKGYEYSAVENDTGFSIYICKAKAAEDIKNDKAIKFGNDKSIKVTGNGADEAVTIDLGSSKGYEISRRTSPEEIVITIPDTSVFGSSRKLVTGGSRVSYVNYQKSGKSGAVITIGLTGQFQYKTAETEDGLTISFAWPSYKNIRYNNNYDRVYFLIKNASLTKGTKDLKRLYTSSKDSTGHVYTITFPSGNADINEGMLYIGDEYLKSFEVRKNGDNTTSLIFTGYPENSYVVFTRESGDTAITIVKPASSGRKIVVLDAGHGGTAIGTAYGKQLVEKDLNLDIAKRTEALLRAKGADVYMMRSDDTNVDNYERVYIANALRASLFLSIHINGAASKSIQGTMTLYCPTSKSGFTGKEFAQIVQKNMLKTLKTADKGLRQRPDLIVLRETNMPAALAEVAFLTNAADRSRLSNDAFRQKAAQSLCDSVMEALKKVK
jgi:N-acetylmuramoyl-L-alanine amidase